MIYRNLRINKLHTQVPAIKATVYYREHFQLKQKGFTAWEYILLILICGYCLIGVLTCLIYRFTS